MPDTENLPRELVEMWARAEVERLRVTPDDLLGFCPRCETFRRRRETRQVERDECCVYACRICGATIDESPPF